MTKRIQKENKVYGKSVYLSDQDLDMLEDLCKKYKAGFSKVLRSAIKVLHRVQFPEKYKNNENF